MTVRELVETLIHNYDLDDEVMYDISNTKDNIKKLWYVCTIIQNYCEAHNDCEFCPFHDYWNSCMIKNAAEVPTDELWKLFPENITEGE